MTILQSAIDALEKADSNTNLPSDNVTNNGDISNSSTNENVTVNKTDSNSSDLKTGDPTSIWGWMSLAISSFGASRLTWKVKKSKHEDEE